MNTAQPTDLESRHLALKIAAEKTPFGAKIEEIVDGAEKLLRFLLKSA